MSEPGLKLKGLGNSGVSVVIVCYNSRGRLRYTLEHLSKQAKIDFRWEVVLVDNASSDDTASVAREIWLESGDVAPLSIVQELRPGTMYARRKGMMEAQYRYILFCDDDNWLSPYYLKKAYDIISQGESVAAAGGMGIFAFEDEQVPGWVTRFQHNFAVGPQGRQDGDTTLDKGCLYTAGTILDKVWLDKLYNEYGFVSTMKGRDGKSLMAGEDTELTYALRLIGGRLYYSSELQFRHYMPSGRLRWKYLRNLNTSMGRSDFLLYPYTEFFRDGKTNQPVWKLVAVRFIFLMRAAFNALASAFRAGSPAVLRYERAKGEIVAILFNMEQMKRSRAWIIQASEQLQRK